MKKITIALLSLALIAGMTGCDKYLDVNKNTDAPDQVDAPLYLAGLLSAYQGFYWDIRALGPLTQMMGTSSYTTYAQNYYTQGSDAAGEMWRMTYWLQGMNLENMVNQAKEQEMWTLAGIGMAIKAFSWDCIAKYHAEAPLKQVFEPGRLSFDYDPENEIMDQVREWAKEAITLLEMNDETEYGNVLKNNDLSYGGDKAKWIKFAHSIIVSDLAALTNKKDFSSAYAQELIEHAALAISSNDDNFIVKRGGGAGEAQFSAYNNFWGTYRGNLTNVYWQSDYIVQIMTGTVPQYDESTGDRVDAAVETARSKWELAPNQIICDTIEATGHYDPRVIAKLCSVDGAYYDKMTDADAIKKFIFYGSTFTGTTSPMGGTAPNLYGVRANSASVTYDGGGRWLFRDDAPYILLTASEIQFELAEAYWKLGQKAQAFAAWKKGVSLDMEFTGNYLNPGSLKEDGGNPVLGGGLPGGSQIAKATYNTLANEYVAGPFVEGLSLNDFTLSHIMMQKYVALWPWGALEAWTDLRKYHYDIKYSGEYPSLNNGWTRTEVDQKWDTDPTKVYKGFYLAPAQVEYRRSSYNQYNEGSPCYRVRPRYNSEYMWNLSSLESLKPIAGNADNYQCSIPWFAYPGDYPSSL